MKNIKKYYCQTDLQIKRVNYNCKIVSVAAVFNFLTSEEFDKYDDNVYATLANYCNNILLDHHTLLSLMSCHCRIHVLQVLNH